MQTIYKLYTAISNERRVAMDAAYRTASRERGAARMRALRTWVEEFEDDAITRLAYVATRGGSSAQFKLSCELLETLSPSDSVRRLLVGELLGNKGKAQQAVVAQQWRGGDQAEAIAELLETRGPARPEGEAKLTLANIAALGGPPERRQPLLEVFVQHSSATVRSQAIAELAAIGVVTEDPMRGCPLDEKALRGLLSLGARADRQARGPAQPRAVARGLRALAVRGISPFPRRGALRVRRRRDHRGPRAGRRGLHAVYLA